MRASVIAGCVALNDTPAQEVPPTLVVRGGQLFDAEVESDEGSVHPLGQFWIAGDTILGERPADTVVPVGVPVLDATGCTLVPGLFDLHVHLAVPGGSMAPTVNVTQRENLETALAFGVTDVVDLLNDAKTVFALRDESRGSSSLARVYAAGAAFTAPGGHGTEYGVAAYTCTTVEDVGRHFDDLLQHQADVVKGIIEHGGWAMIPPTPTLSDPVVNEIGRRCHLAHLPFFCHIWTVDEAKSAVRGGADALAHGVFSGEVDDELIELMLDQGTACIPTLSVVVGAMRIAAGRSPYTKEHLAGRLDPDLIAALADPASLSWVTSWKEADEQRFFANLRRMHDAGVRIGTGTDAGNPLAPHGPALLFEIALYVEAGLTPAQALRSATLDAARILGVDKTQGSLTAGKKADLLLVRGDPTKEVGALWDLAEVVKSGVVVDRAALRKKLATRIGGPVVRKAGSDVPASFDEFDDGDLKSAWGGTWTATSDSVIPGGKSTCVIEAGKGDAAGRLVVKGRLAEGFPQGPFVDVSLQLDSLGKQLVDASSFKGVKVRARGTVRSWKLIVERAAVKDWDRFAASLEIGDDWQEFELPFASFQQAGFGKRVPSGTADLRGFTLESRKGAAGEAPTAGAAELGDYTLEVDWIRLYQ